MERLGEERIEAASKMLKVLSDKGRLKLLMTLKGREASVLDLAEKLGMEQSALSHQLRVLKKARLVKYRQEGKKRFYSLDDDHVFSILEMVFEHLEEDHEEC